ncbi:Legionella pneumophila major outer membrane protein precursor [Legionella massiliensis]|uniref:Legionella pneumophila major outer membrane protein n=1 Tax=Legionella massiliensis TaxID=1034943 RepID=A0A078KVJ4_9GAMM|nr:Lpg1974 family pore-forming outer membrane protein [Legionella massiliensis]CDZ75748.1 Legionella pneumophila major outer membrane protein precursor [Legionella massiliensis]CEE11486.1 Legionella pneumophila major outer membrane protein precursor [Legionella massiliensis]
MGNQSSGLNLTKHSKYNGYSPRLGIDSRYEFGRGFGFIAGRSVAYYRGKMDYQDINALPSSPFPFPQGADRIDHHGVVNLRGKIGVDYVYQFQSTSTVGLELGYQADNYNNVFTDLCTGARFPMAPNDPAGATNPVYINSVVRNLSSSLDGFYVNLKATFG